MHQSAITSFTSTDQEDRTHSIEQFRSMEKDVLVATDVASKGLDFPDIKHVINYDMPEDIENYGKITWAITQEPTMWFLNTSDTNQACTSTEDG